MNQANVTRPILQEEEVAPAAVPSNERRPRAALQSWEDRLVEDSLELLTIDVRHSRALAPRLRHFDFGKMVLAGGYGRGVYPGQVLPLQAFPHLVKPLRAALVEATRSHHEGHLHTTLPILVNTCLRIFSWMLQEGYYQLRQVPHKAVLDLVNTLRRSTWSVVLRHRRAYARLCIAARQDPSIAQCLRSNSNIRFSAINVAQLSALVGLPLAGRDVPISFRRRIALLGNQDWRRPVGDFKGMKPGAALKSTTEALNLLALSEGEHDSFSFIPFPTVVRPTENQGQTPNLQLADALKIFRHSLEWIYDRAPVVIDVLQRLRVIVAQQAKGLSNHELGKDVSELRRYVGELAQDHPWIDEHEFKLAKGNSLLRWVQKLFIACASQSAINHGRRANEVVGQNLPYGLYFGCVTAVHESLNDFRLEVYCEKGYRDYKTFPANSIVHDVVSLLERLFIAMRPLSSPESPPAASREEARRDKLFVLRSLTVKSFGERPHDFNFRSHLKEFLSEAGVKPTLFEGSQWPFRRMFCLLYVNRFDDAEIVALSKQMGHLSLASTIPYQHDEVERPPGTSAPEIFGRSDVDLNEMLDALRPAKFEYLVDKVMAMYGGERFSGMFPRLVQRLTKSLSKKASFSSASLARKAHTVAELLDQHGYRVNPMRHTSCMADTPGATAKRAKCYADGSLHRENSSHEMCSGCIHSLKSPLHRENLVADAAEAERIASELNTPEFLRPMYSSTGRGLRKIEHLETRIAADHRRAIASLVDSWTALVASDGE